MEAWRDWSDSCCRLKGQDIACVERLPTHRAFQRQRLQSLFLDSDHERQIQMANANVKLFRCVVSQVPMTIFSIGPDIRSGL
jgi:hypothetical protein